jgi:hypothetical protein
MSANETGGNEMLRVSDMTDKQLDAELRLVCDHPVLKPVMGSRRAAIEREQKSRQRDEALAHYMHGLKFPKAGSAFDPQLQVTAAVAKTMTNEQLLATCGRYEELSAAYYEGDEEGSAAKVDYEIEIMEQELSSREAREAC